MNDGLTGPSFTPETSVETTGGEQRLCDDLARDASMRVEDTSNGVAIVLMPKADVDLVSIRNEARGLERSMTRQAAAAETGHAGVPTCALFDLARSGALVSLTELPNAVRLVVTSDDAGSVRRIRAVSRAFVARNVPY